jgi:alpha-1,3-mannosyl-glycoprotein beta-1,2-N-acetylglucosaminyltransferase
VAPDFFSYFHAAAHMLHRDDTLLAASAYNDNGMKVGSLALT